ncbi:MAG: hypothetical protein U5J78_02155 [Parasphingorhabdus sp.]|nr:hypothetical protein [Parasphingorhabdus sp.]
MMVGLYIGPAYAQQAVTSAAPSSVSVTIYRNPNRAAAQAMNTGYLGGYALITETRTIDLPAGEVDLRFEGVAGGIVPQSAIVTGLADGIVEKNRDAQLLSPSALWNGYLGRRVILRRTNAKTGETREYQADIRTDASGGMVVETTDGLEALQCTGFNETIIYPQVPAGLSAKPTLSVRSYARTATRATVTLSYIATNFDWQANYVANVDADGARLTLFSWVTLANGDETSFVNASTQTVAGKLNKRRDNVQRATGGQIALNCWPQGRTDQIPEIERDLQTIVVTGMRREAMFDKAMATLEMESPAPAPPPVAAQQEELGDLKLYRIPVTVTVAAQSQKQIRMFEKSAVAFDTIDLQSLWPGQILSGQPLNVALRLQNKKADGLGLPLPAGRLIAFRPDASGARLLVGEGSIDDKAVGEEAEIVIARSAQMFLSSEQQSGEPDDDSKVRIMKLTITNAAAGPKQAEISLTPYPNERIEKPSSKLARKNGQPLWKVVVPANGSAQLTYRLVRKD